MSSATERFFELYALNPAPAAPVRIVPGIFTVRRAHEIGDQIEEAIRAVFPGIEVTIHIEPIEEQTAYEDSALVFLEREARNKESDGTPTPSERGPGQQSPIPP